MFIFISMFIRNQMYDPLQTYIIVTRKMRLGDQKIVVFVFLSPS